MKAEQRLALLEQERRAQLLEIKELQQLQEMLLHRQQELSPVLPNLVTHMPMDLRAVMPQGRLWALPEETALVDLLPKPPQPGTPTPLLQLLLNEESEKSTPQA